MTITDDIVKSLRNPTPLYAVAGTADLAAEYAVKAREAYDELAERGKGAVATWRGEAADEVVEIAAAVEPNKSSSGSSAGTSSSAGTGAAKPAAARKTTPRKPAAAKRAADKSAK